MADFTISSDDGITAVVTPGDSLQATVVAAASATYVVDGALRGPAGADGAAGGGDMAKAVYDTNNNGVVDNSTLLNGQADTYYLSRANHTGSQAESTITNLVSDLAAKEPTVTGGTSAQYYRGDKTFQTLNTTAVPEGTNLYYTNARASAAAPVQSVAGRTGAVVLAESDITNLTADLAGKQATGNYITALTGDATASGPGSSAVTLATVNSNTGTFGNSTTVPVITANAKGLITAVTTATISMGTASPLTTKGDLYGFDTANNRIPVGSNNFVLTADNTLSLGLKWAAIPTQTATGTAGGDLTGTYPNPTLIATGTAGTYGSASTVPVTTYDSKGRETAVTNTSIQITETQVTNLTTDLSAKQGTITLTTTGSSGPATLISNTLNIPQISGSGNTTNITTNSIKIDAANAGTTTYGVLGGLVNGSNVLFTVSNGSYVSGTLRLWVYGQLQTLGTTGDYTETSSGSGTFTFATAPPSGAPLIVAYVTSSTSSGNIYMPVSTKTTTYAASVTNDRYIRANATGGIFTVTLPDAAASSGFRLGIKKIDSSVNAVTVATTSSQTIDGATTYSLPSQYKFVEVVSNGTNWDIWGNN